MSKLDKSKEIPTKLKVLWHSVAPWVASGYGKPTREICTRLPKYGFKTYISAYYGAEPGGTPPYPVPVLPKALPQLGQIRLEVTNTNHLQHFYAIMGKIV